MGRSTVDLVEYSDAWPSGFEAAKAELAAILGDTAVVIEHIGSTAVPGLVAKPTIDIAIGVRSIGAVHERRAALEAAGYEFRAGFHDEHLFLRRIVEDERTHHLHFRVFPSDEFDDWIVFRDLLRRSGDARDAYLAEKRRLAERFPRDRGAYSEGKTAVVLRLVEAARQNAES